MEKKEALTILSSFLEAAKNGANIFPNDSFSTVHLSIAIIDAINDLNNKTQNNRNEYYDVFEDFIENVKDGYIEMSKVLNENYYLNPINMSMAIHILLKELNSYSKKPKELDNFEKREDDYYNTFELNKEVNKNETLKTYGVQKQTTWDHSEFFEKV